MNAADLLPPMRPLTLRDLLRQHQTRWTDWLDHDLLNRRAADPIARIVVNVVNHAEGLVLTMQAAGMNDTIVETVSRDCNEFHRREG